MRKPVKFGSLSIGKKFYRTIDATVLDMKTETAPKEARYPWNAIGVDDGNIHRVPDDALVYVEEDKC